jgi:hypothetical protein
MSRKEFLRYCVFMFVLVVTSLWPHNIKHKYKLALQMIERRMDGVVVVCECGEIFASKDEDSGLLESRVVSIPAHACRRTPEIKKPYSGNVA